MPKAVKILVYAVSGVVVLLAVAVVSVYAMSSSRIGRVYDVAGELLPLSSDSASLAEGERLATLMGCTDCHGANLEGTLLIDAPVFARLWAPNLTAGRGGVGSAYTVADFELAIRHGVGRDGRSLMVMPSLDYNHLSDEDIGRVIAYVMQVPPVDHMTEERRLGPAGRIASLASTGALFHATAIDHNAPHPARVARTVSAEYGAYFLRACAGCHNPELTGGPMPGAWTEADFARAVREGVRPDGSELNPAMPWRAFGGFTDEEINAMWMYLRSLEPKPKRTQ